MDSKFDLKVFKCNFLKGFQTLLNAVRSFSCQHLKKLAVKQHLMFASWSHKYLCVTVSNLASSDENNMVYGHGLSPKC